MSFNTKELSLIIVFSAMGAVLSVPLGYISNYMTAIPFLPLGTGQILAGFHLLVLVLSARYVRKPGAASMTGAVKGLVEAALFSFHGLPVILLSVVQGLVIDAVILLSGGSTWGLFLGCGLSSMSSVLFLQFFVMMPFGSGVWSFMYLLAFASGALFGGYLGERLTEMVGSRTSYGVRDSAS